MSTALDAPATSDQRAIFALRLLVLALIIGLLSWMFLVTQNSTQFIVMSLGILGTTVLSLPILFRRDYDLFEPLTAVFFLFLFGAPVKLCYLATVGDANPYIAERLLNWRPLAELVPGLSIAICGIAFLVLGYSMPASGRRFQPLLFPGLARWSGKRLHVICLLLFCFSAVCFIAFAASTGVSLSSLSAKRFTGDGESSGEARVFSYTYYLYRLAAFSKFTTYLSLIWLLKEKRWNHWLGLLFAVSVLQTIALCIVMSSRAGVALLLIDIMVISYYLRGRSIKLMRVIAISGFTVVAAMGILAARVEAQHSVSEIIEKTMAGRDMMDISKTIHIINAVPSKIEFRNGEMLYGWATALIPRSIWPDKPMWMERGHYLLTNVYNSDSKVAGIPPGYIAELYWNFGFIGTMIGMLLLGYLFRIAYLAFSPQSDNPVAVLLYTFFLTRFVLVTLGNDLASGGVKFLLDAVPVLMILVVIRSPIKVLSYTYSRSKDNEHPEPEIVDQLPSSSIAVSRAVQ